MFDRIKRWWGKIRSWPARAFSCVRRWPRKIWNWLAAVPGRIGRWVKNRWPVKLLILAVTVLFAVGVLEYSNPRLEPLTGPPAVSAEWTLPTLTNHYLGLPFDATVKITAPLQLFVDLDSLPQEGEMLGAFEVWRRDVSANRVNGDRKVVEVRYQLLYLLPLEKEVFTPRELPRIEFGYRYQRQYFKGGVVYWVKQVHYIFPRKIYIARRVGPDDKPYPLAGPVEEKPRFGKILRIAGAVIVLAIPFFWFVKLLVDMVAEAQAELERRAAYRSPSELLRETWELWLKTGDYRYFLQAAILVRDNVRRQLGLPPGGLLPRGEFWLVTTEALYSGRKFVQEKIRGGFGLFERTVSDEADKPRR